MTASGYVYRYIEGVIDSLLKDKTRKPGNRPIPVEVKNELWRIFCEEKPEDATRWNTRELTKRLGIGRSSMKTILRERGLKPHLVRIFRFSKDPGFEKKLEDVVDRIRIRRITQ